MKLKNKKENQQPLYSYKSASSSSSKQQNQDDNLTTDENSLTNTTFTNTPNDTSLDYNTSSNTNKNNHSNSGTKIQKSFPLCSIICTKSSVIIVDVLFLIVGILLILFGVWTILNKHEYLNLVTSSLYLSSTYLLIIGGVVVVLNEILGIAGAWLESKKILIIFISLLSLVFLMEIGAGILAFAYRAHLKESLKFDLERFILEEYGEKNFDAKTKLLDDLQRNFKCCGATNFLDYSNSKYVSMSEMTSPLNFNKVAESCCKTSSALCGSLIHPSNIYYKGCVSSLENYLKDQILLLGFVSVGSCLLLVINIMLTCWLIRRINERKQYDYVRTDDERQ